MTRGFIKDFTEIDDWAFIELYPGAVWANRWNSQSYCGSIYSFVFLWTFIREVEPAAGEYVDTPLNREQCIALRRKLAQLHTWVGMTDTHAKLHRVIRYDWFPPNKQYFKRNRQMVMDKLADFVEVLDMALEGDGILWLLGY